jgi:hypothetical protein
MSVIVKPKPPKRKSKRKAKKADESLAETVIGDFF